MSSSKASAVEAFRSAFGGDPEGGWSAPGRVNLIGEHTDYNGGWVLPFALDMRITVSARRRDDGQVSVRSVQQSGEVTMAIEDISPASAGGHWSAYALGVVWALQQSGYAFGGADLLLDGQVPSGAGLSSSAAIECAVGMAMTGLYGIDVRPDLLARLAQRAENEVVGVPCGLMDQMAVSTCQAQHALLFDTRDDVREQEPFAPEREGLAVVVVDTRVKHAHADGAYAQRRASCERAAKTLGVETLREIGVASLPSALAELPDDETRRRVRHVVSENARVLDTIALLRAGRLTEIGPLLVGSHESLRDDFEVSCDELDVAVATCLASGALGARMTGGGFGGSAIALIETDRVPELTTALETAFVGRSFTAPHVFAASTADGVRRDW